jgi:glucose-1-phosphate thymidylyltransferase
MKGVILAGGTGTRLQPLTLVVNKHLLPVGRKPMILHAIEKMHEAGIDDILLVIGKQSAGIYADFLGNGEQWGVRLTYKIQDRAGGIAEALLLAESFIRPEDRLTVILGDNLFEESLEPFARSFLSMTDGARVLLKQVNDPRRYGVPVLQDGRIARIEEKPENPLSDYCVTGIYFYDSTVFEKIRSIAPSPRGELEITDVNNLYAAEGKLSYDVLNGWWIDAGTIDSLNEAGNRVLGGGKS